LLILLYLFSVTKLSPGVTYTINVIPYNKRYIGMKYTIVTKTDGNNIESTCLILVFNIFYLLFI